ncbi:energy-coupling factor transport system ATP-binding protein [Arthrobacter sp. SLBN-100]|uniref:ABC transporter ATP-binding protein n=1 Tax=Arthrobacter sp. SLBN-100 TaxID=2768450 RepID=UPI00115114CD|nr:ATP-binding cassette domain-containing protein [Arthrobacter sp. SLBN-100]TQJ66183.1 energy-coupling factor transport system ATP-binding protein [Arthrobacter sp. SLBN-100]
MESPTALAAGIRSFAFHDEAAPVLHDVHVSFEPGTFTAVLGPSGSGKSTLGRLLAGWLPPGPGGRLEGQLTLGGTRLQFDGAADDPRINPAQWGRQVGFVPQDASAILSTVRATVAEELAFGLENAGTDRPAMQAAVERTAALLGLSALLDRHPDTLSGGQQRRLAIGCAVIAEPEVLIMDEPLASLDAAGADELAILLASLVTRGTAVVILSQAVEEALCQAERWIVLDAGTATASGTPAEFTSAPGRLPAGIRWPGTMPAPRQELLQRPRAKDGPALARDLAAPDDHRDDHSAAATPVLELRGVNFGYADKGRSGRKARAAAGGTCDERPQPVLRDIDLELPAGQIVAVTGPNGAGKSTFLRHLNGLLRPTSGSVLVHGEDIDAKPVGEVAASVGLLFQNPRHQLFERTAAREVRFGLERRVGASEAAARTEAALAAVGLSAAGNEHPAELPASRQRLLALATVLARKPAVLALDEPTVALDGDGLRLLDAAVRSAAAAGAAVVLVTHDVPYARSVADRLLTLDGGRLAAL